MLNFAPGESGHRIIRPALEKSDPWFLISSDARARRIGSFMSLLDAGDYDHDGQSDAIFFLSQGENIDGLVMFDASFKEPIRFAWSYH